MVMVMEMEVMRKSDEGVVRECDEGDGDGEDEEM